LCEAVFQAGAVFISEMMHREQADSDSLSKSVPVLTRILGAKFKREVRPGDTIEIMVGLKEKVSSAWFMKGTVRIDGKIAVQVEFACAQKGG
jgi:3-hydroxyacyl-[acyl-carrier-protein] dehydratase